MTENQKLREALQAIANIDDATNHSVDVSAALDRIGQIARQALAQPTADHLPDAWKMIETAVPVGERERFEAYFAWSRQSKGANRRPNFERFEDDGTYKDDHTQRHWWTWQQALSAGDAVDAQRWLRDFHIGDSPESISLQSAKRPGLDAAIDAALRAKEAK